MSSNERPGLAAVSLESHGADQASEGESPLNRWSCRNRYRRMSDWTTGEVREMDCKRWACVVHGPLLAWRWRQRVSMVPWKLMLTLTLVPEDRGEARKAWTKLMRWLKTRGVRTYLRVMELGGKNGMRHWHVLVDADRVEQAELSDEAASCGLGSVVWVSRVRSQVGAVYYVLGYVFKSLGLDDTRQAGWRKVTVSRNIPSWTKVVEARADYDPDRDPGHWLVIDWFGGKRSLRKDFQVRADGDTDSDGRGTSWGDPSPLD